MSEQVFNTCQLGRQAGTFYTVGGSAAAAVIFPVSEPIVIDLDRGSDYPTEDYGRNIDAHAGRGHHGLRAATLPLRAPARFQDLMEVLEMHFAGDIAPTGGPVYTWVYPFEVGAPTIVPYTVESGSETSQDQYEAVGVLIDELTLGFDDLESPGAHPWMIDASALAIDRAPAALTAGLSAPSVLQTMQGHLSIIKFGSTSTAFASLSEIASSLVGFSMVTRRSLVRRPYGSASDLAAGYGFSAKSSGESTFKVKVSADTKTTLHDAWNSSGADLGEQRVRVTVDGSGNNVAHLDFRLGLTAVPVGERSGERVYECTGKIIDDDTLDAPAQWTIVNDIAALGSASAGS